jgi:hypothetical protein
MIFLLCVCVCVCVCDGQADGSRRRFVDFDTIRVSAYVIRSPNAEHGGVGKTRAWTQNYRSTALSIEQLNKHCSN